MWLVVQLMTASHPQDIAFSGDGKGAGGRKIQCGTP
jgi:hypothetical protein